MRAPHSPVDTATAAATAGKGAEKRRRRENVAYVRNKKASRHIRLGGKAASSRTCDDYNYGLPEVKKKDVEDVALIWIAACTVAALCFLSGL